MLKMKLYLPLILAVAAMGFTSASVSTASAGLFDAPSWMKANPTAAHPCHTPPYTDCGKLNHQHGPSKGSVGHAVSAPEAPSNGGDSGGDGGDGGGDGGGE